MDGKGPPLLLRHHLGEMYLKKEKHFTYLKHIHRLILNIILFFQSCIPFINGSFLLSSNASASEAVPVFGEWLVLWSCINASAASLALKI